MKKISRFKRWLIHLLGGHVQDERELTIICPYWNQCKEEYRNEET
jgi:hypothetical protein